MINEKAIEVNEENSGEFDLDEFMEKLNFIDKVKKELAQLEDDNIIPVYNFCEKLKEH